MSGFASSALLDLVAKGLAAQGIRLARAPSPPQQESAPVRADGDGASGRSAALAPLADKRELLAAVHEVHGLRPIMVAGYGVRSAGRQATLDVLTEVADPQALLRRWTRLEGFYHSSNRIRVVTMSDRRAEFARYALRGGQPRPYENALMLGVLAGLFERVGCRGLQCSVRAGGRWREVYAEASGFAEPSAASRLLRWRFEWDAVGARTNLAGTRPHRLPMAGESWVDAVRSRIEPDVFRRWSITQLADEFGCSSRSLQRHLASEGTSLSAIVALARVRHAQTLLMRPGIALVEVGYACGFSDQAHFVREFRRAMAMTPGRFRAALG